jgi:hypothetical protein
VLAAWVLFRAGDLPATLTMYRSMLGFGTASGWTLQVDRLFPHLPAGLQDPTVFIWIGILCGFCWVVPSLRHQTDPLLAQATDAAAAGLRVGRSWAIGSAILAWLAVMFLARPTEFLYYQF